MILMRIEYQSVFKVVKNICKRYTEILCVLYTQRISQDCIQMIYGNHIRISSVKARYISNQLQRNNYDVLNILHA